MAVPTAPAVSGGAGWCSEHHSGMSISFLGFAWAKVDRRWGGGGGGAWSEQRKVRRLFGGTPAKLAGA